MRRLFGFMLFSMIALVTCVEKASAGPLWFSGYIDHANDYRYYAFTDWDSPLYGIGIEHDTSLFGINAPDRRVDGHLILEADGTGFAKVVESTGSLVSWAPIGQVFSVSFQFGGWWQSPGYPATLDTRHDWDANFLNIVSGPVAAPVPEPETYAMMLAGLGLLGVVARRRKQKSVA